MAAYFWVGGAGTWDATTTTHWATSSGGAGSAGVPISTDTATFDSASNATAYAVTVAATAVCGDFTAAGPTSGNVSFTSSGLTVSGSLTFAVTGITWVSGSITFAATTTGKTVSTNGITMGGTIFNGVGGEWTLASALNSSGTFNLLAGTFNTAGYSVTSNLFTSIAGGTRTLNLGNSTWTLLIGTTSTAWNLTSAGLTFLPGTSTISLTASTAKTFQSGNGVTYYNINQGGAGALTITGNNLTFNDIQNSYVATGATTITIQSTTLNVTNFTATGAAGKVLTLNSNTAGTARTLTKIGGGVVSVNYMSIQDSTVTGTGATWYAGANSTNVSNNTGWIFSAAPLLFNLVARLFNTGIFASSNTISLDEVTKTTSNISPAAIYSSMFDEVSQSAVPMRILQNGNMQVSGSFDEVTGIS